MPPVTSFMYDLVVIGGGSGGVRVSRWSAGLGAKVACVELPAERPDYRSHNHLGDPLKRRGGLGGTCVERGCVPKKLLMLASSYAEEMEEARQNGWNVEIPEKVDLKTVIDKKRTEIQRLEKVYGGILSRAGVENIVGHATVVGTNEVKVDYMDPETFKVTETKVLTTKYICIATGSKAVRLPIPGAQHAIVSDDALSLETLPETMVIVGAGYISLEFACIYANFGSKVHVLYRKPLPLNGFDQDVRTLVASELSKKKNLTLHPEITPTAIHKVEKGYVVDLSNGESIACDVVMMGTGRVPNVDCVGDLAGLGVEFDQSKHGAIKVDEYSNTSVPSIKAIGDVTGRMDLTPVALMEGTCLAETLFGREKMACNHENIVSAVFTQPPVATVGLTEEQAIAKYKDVDVYTSTFRPMKFIFSQKDEKIFMKMIVDAKTQVVVGLHMVGIETPEIVQGFAVAIKNKLTKAQVDATTMLHPTSAEEVLSMRTATRKIRNGQLSTL